MTNEDIDFSLYIRPPVFNAGSGLALSRSLLSAMPKDASPGMRKAARRMRSAAMTLQEQVLQRGREGGVQDARPADQAMDAAVNALHTRLAAYAALPWGTYPEAEKAQRLLARLFPQGLVLLRLPYQEEWAAVDGLLKTIDSEDLAKDLDRLCDEAFLENVRAEHKRYGDALGITRATGPTADAALAEPRRALARAMTSYATQTLAWLEEGDHLAAVRAALHPFDAFRAASTRRGRGASGSPEEPVTGGEPGEGDPAAPTPPLPEGDGA